jgi:hypothetical protein
VPMRRGVQVLGKAYEFMEQTTLLSNFSRIKWCMEYMFRPGNGEVVSLYGWPTFFRNIGVVSRKPLFLQRSRMFCNR